jgi:hypothetical protein
MKGVCGGGCQIKFKETLPGVRSRLVKNQGTHFILHFSFFITSSPYSSLLKNE